MPAILLELIHTVAFFALCGACFSGGLAGRAFAWTPARWLGNVSYSYYLLHGVTVMALSIAISKFVGHALPTWVVWALLPPTFLVSLLPPFVLFVFIERPISLRPRSEAVIRAPVV